MKRVTNIIALGTLLALSSSAVAQEVPLPELAPRVGIDSYIHIGQMFSTGEGSRVDELRMLSFGSIGLTWFPTSTIGVRAGAGSLLGVLGPSFEASLAGEFHPWGVAETGLFGRFGARGIFNVAIPCANDDASCADEAQEARDNRPADAIGATLHGIVGEAGVGAQLAVQRKGVIFLYGSYLGGPLSGSGGLPPLEGYYHGYLGTLGIRLFL